MCLRGLIAPPLATHPAPGRADGTAVVGAVGAPVALGVVVEAVAAVEVTALHVAHGVALVVVEQGGHAAIPARLLVGLEAVVLVPLTLGIEARCVAVAVPDPVRVAVRRTGAWLGLVLGLRARVKE